MEERLTSTEAMNLQSDVVRLLRQQAPSGFKCIFLNCEMHDTPGGMTTSADLFAVSKSLFGNARRNQWTLDASSLKVLNQLGRLLLENSGQDHVVVDLLVWNNGAHQCFVDRGSLRRLGSDGDDFFKMKHKSYVHLEPLLAEVD